MRILLVEDDDPKRERICEFLKGRFASAHIELARSVRSAVSCLRAGMPDLVMLDMSLPTFDVGPEESGGRPQGFGGLELLRYMDRFKIAVPTIVVTAYEAFFSEDRKGIKLDTLSSDLEGKHPLTYVGLVYYNSIYGGWEDQLNSILDRVCWKAEK
jgi:CheY-like chemotaxis protein